MKLKSRSNQILQIWIIGFLLFTTTSGYSDINKPEKTSELANNVSKLTGVWSLILPKGAKKYSESYIYIKHIDGNKFAFGRAYPMIGERIREEDFFNSIGLSDSKGNLLQDSYITLKLRNNKLTAGFYSSNYLATHGELHSVYLELSLKDNNRLTLKEYGNLGISKNLSKMPLSQMDEYEKTKIKF